MTRIKFLGVCLIAVLVSAAITATSAFAEEKTKMLPEAGVTYVGKGGAGKLESVGGSAISCTSGSGSGTIESANSGKYKTVFAGCELLGGKCTTNGNPTPGNIENKGLYDFWLALETLNGVPETLVGALVFFPEETHFTCVVLGFNQLVLVKGCVAALATPLNTLATLTKDTFAQSKGVQLITLVLEPGATKDVNCILLSSINGGAFEQSALEAVAENSTFKKGETAVTVLLMNPEAHE